LSGVGVGAGEALPQLLVTRPIGQAPEFLDALRARGWPAEALPLIDISPPPDLAAVHTAWRGLASRDWVFFVSPSAVQQFFAARPAGAAWPAAVRAGALGPGTLRALAAAGVPAGQVTAPPPLAAQVDSEALWAQLAGQAWAERQVLIVRGDGGRAWLADQLKAQGAQVDFLQAYARQAPAWGAAEQHLLQAALDRPGQHLWLFSSSQAIDHLERLCPEGRALWPRAHALASHPRIAERAHAAGFGRVLLSAPDLEALVACIQSAAW
jgi:uroporphyrinogen-III synthase